MWSGDDYVGTWNATGENRPHPDNSNEVRGYANMFDGNSETYWHGFMPATVQNTVKVMFKAEINFEELIFYARPDKVYNQSRYSNVCLYLDGVMSVCTAEQQIKPGQKISLKPNEAVLTRMAELRFPSNTVAVVAELQIQYTFPEGEGQTEVQTEGQTLFRILFYKLLFGHL